MSPTSASQSSRSPPFTFVGTIDVPEILELEVLAVLLLVERGAAPKAHRPEDLEKLFGDDQRRLAVQEVPVEEHDFLEPADVVGVRVGDEVVVDLGDREAEEGEGLGGARAAIDQEVGLAFHDEDVVLEEFL